MDGVWGEWSEYYPSIEYAVMEIIPGKDYVIVLKISMVENHVQGLIQMTGKNVMFNLVHVIYT